MREDGTVGINYNVKKVYDVSQVNTRQRNRKMIYDDKILLKVFLNSSISKVKIVDSISNTNAGAKYEFDDDTLYIARGAESPKIFYEVTKELAKQEIGENDKIDDFKNYCISYMLCKKYNIDVSNYRFNEIPLELQNLNAREIREELQPIRDAMESINSRITEQVQNITRENRNKNKER